MVLTDEDYQRIDRKVKLNGSMEEKTLAQEQMVQTKKEKKKMAKTLEIVPGIPVAEREVSWFVSRMFNPEENLWVWVRRLANLATFPILIMTIIMWLS